MIKSNIFKNFKFIFKLKLIIKWKKIKKKRRKIQF